MISLRSLFIHVFSIQLLLLVSHIGYSQQTTSAPPAFRLSIENVALTTDKTIEFDLYLLETDQDISFELALIQAGIMVNPEIYNGGKVKASILSGSSQLIEAQHPLNILFAQEANIIKLPSRTLKPLPKGTPAIPRGTIISAIAPGTRVCRIKLTNSVAFSKVPIALSFNFARAPYPTSVYQYISGINTPLICNNSNCIVKP
jgi:hypothetical protein